MAVTNDLCGKLFFTHTCVHMYKVTKQAQYELFQTTLAYKFKSCYSYK